MEILDGVKTLAKLPYQIAALLLGAGLIALSSINYGGPQGLSTHDPQWGLFTFGGLLILLSPIAYFGSLYFSQRSRSHIGAGVIDTSAVTEKNGILSTRVGDCDIEVRFGRLEDFRPEDTVFVLPCNEYFDHGCILDGKGALGSFVERAFPGRADDFAALVQTECRRVFDTPQPQQKTNNEQAPSFGAGRALLLASPLNVDQPLALVSTTTQRAKEGLIARISYLFGGMNELVTQLTNTPRLKRVAMPLLGAGHGGLSPALALVGLLLALAEVVRFSPGAQQLRKVTIVIFRKDEQSKPQVDPAFATRALALIARQG